MGIGSLLPVERQFLKLESSDYNSEGWINFKLLEESGRTDFSKDDASPKE